MGKRTVEQLTQTARNLTFEGKKVIRDADDKVTKGAALKISRLPPDQQEEAAVQPTTSPSPPLCFRHRILPSSGGHFRGNDDLAV